MGLAWTGRDRPPRHELDRVLVYLLAVGAAGFLLAGWALWQS